jgi:hypothetical protein
VQAVVVAEEQAGEIPVDAVPDPEDPGEWDESDEAAVVDIAVTTLASLQRTVTGLRVAAGVAAALWVVALVVSFSTFWSQYHDIESNTFTGISGGDSGDALMRTLAATLGNTWGYLIAAVLAYGAATYAESRRASLLLDALAD